MNGVVLALACKDESLLQSFVVECSDYSEIVAAALECPTKVWVGTLADIDDLARYDDNFIKCNIVAGQPIFVRVMTSTTT